MAKHDRSSKDRDSISRETKLGRDSKTGRFVISEKMDRVGKTAAYAGKGSRPLVATEVKIMFARPVAQKADPRQFAADLLASDKIIMEYLAK